MKNFKINTTPEQLSPEDIARGKNFEQVLKAYGGIKPPFFKTGKFWLGSSAALVSSIVAVVIYLKIIATSALATPGFINPPIAGVNIELNSFVVNADSASTINYPSGSKINVPAKAFLDEQGNVVTGKVDVQYREFNKVSDVFLAGIPMTYDSAGEQLHFETAGMMQIAASQNGKALKTNPTALIQVNMVSHNAEDKFNTYYLDTVEKKWKYLPQTNYVAVHNTCDTDIAAPQASDEVKTIAKDLNKAKKELALEEKTRPVEPKKSNPKKQHFFITVDENDFPEIAIYHNVKFEANDPNYNEDKAARVWSNVEIKRIEGSRNYAITFIDPKERYTVIAAPVFLDSDYGAAKNIYDKKYAQYETRLKKKKQESDELARELELRRIAAAAKAEANAERQQKAQTAIENDNKHQREMQGARAEAQAQRDENVRKMIARNTVVSSDATPDLSMDVYRTFQVAKFGLWNSDRPCGYPQGACVVAQLIDSRTKTEIDGRDCFLVEKGNNTLYVYHPGSLGRFCFNPNKENKLWVLTKDQKLALVTTEQFKAAQKTSGEMKLELNVIDKIFKSSDEVKAYIDI